MRSFQRVVNFEVLAGKVLFEFLHCFRSIESHECHLSDNRFVDFERCIVSSSANVSVRSVLRSVLCALCCALCAVHSVLCTLCCALCAEKSEAYKIG